MAIKICLVTGSRAEYDRQYWLIRELSHDKSIDLKLVVTGSHLSGKFGYTVKEIEKDGFSIFKRVDILKDNQDIAKPVAKGVVEFSQLFVQINPDLVIIYGDRFELLSVACACVCMQIPIGHIGGGQVTEGAIDDQIRHMLTKASHLHFVANNTFSKRIKQLGEESWRICVSGSPAIDSIKNIHLLSGEELIKSLNLTLTHKTALVTFHPVTLDLRNLKFQTDNLVKALKEANTRYDLDYIVTYPNADPGNSYIIESIQRFQRNCPKFVKVIKHSGQINYLSLLSCVRMVVGNSSSGIVESPSFGIPVVNIGDRQKGRIFAENIIQADYKKDSILNAIEKALKQKRIKHKNPYGDGKSSQRIVKFIKETFHQKGREIILRKKFVDAL